MKRGFIPATYHCALLATLYVLTLVLSNLDGYLTLLCVETGLCREQNPFMRWALNVSPLFFLVVKNLAVGLFGAVLLVIGVRYQKRLVLLSFVFVFFCYLWVVMFHFYFWWA